MWACVGMSVPQGGSPSGPGGTKTCPMARPSPRRHPSLHQILHVSLVSSRVWVCVKPTRLRVCLCVCEHPSLQPCRGLSMCGSTCASPPAGLCTTASVWCWQCACLYGVSIAVAGAKTCKGPQKKQPSSAGHASDPMIQPFCCSAENR